MCEQSRFDARLQHSARSQEDIEEPTLSQNRSRTAHRWVPRDAIRTDGQERRHLQPMLWTASFTWNPANYIFRCLMYIECCYDAKHRNSKDSMVRLQGYKEQKQIPLPSPLHPNALPPTPTYHCKCGCGPDTHAMSDMFFFLQVTLSRLIKNWSICYGRNVTQLYVMDDRAEPQSGWPSIWRCDCPVLCCCTSIAGCGSFGANGTTLMEIWISPWKP